MEIILNNVAVTDLHGSPYLCAPEEAPLCVHMKDVTISLRENVAPGTFLFDGCDPHTHIVTV